MFPVYYFAKISLFIAKNSFYWIVFTIFATESEKKTDFVIEDITTAPF